MDTLIIILFIFLAIVVGLSLVNFFIKERKESDKKKKFNEILASEKKEILKEMEEDKKEFTDAVIEDYYNNIIQYHSDISFIDFKKEVIKEMEKFEKENGKNALVSDVIDKFIKRDETEMEEVNKDINEESNEAPEAIEEVNEIPEEIEKADEVSEVVEENETISEPKEVNYESKTISELRAIAKENKLTGYTKLNKADLIKFLKEKIA